jgi:hypothetical protein
MQFFSGQIDSQAMQRHNAGMQRTISQSQGTALGDDRRAGQRQRGSLISN